MKSCDRISAEGFSCKQCGNCCLNLDGYYTCATKNDIRMWEENGRNDILRWVDKVGDGIYDIWINPRTGDDVSRCPWLRKLPQHEKYICRIHDMKPEVCKDYPISKNHAEVTGCKGW